MVALTGDASLAAKGAIAGGVAGGVAGSMTDLESDRETERIELRFIGKDVFVGETNAPGDCGGEKQVQSYRFTRAS